MAGLAMLVLAGLLMVGTGLPAFVVLLGVSVLAAAVGLATGTLDWALLGALPPRLVGLLDNDLLQALPLYVLMAALLDRLPVAGLLFRALGRVLGAPALAAVGVGAMVAPMNGSVGAGVAALSRAVHPRLVAAGVPAPRSLAVVCVASTLGVVVPPSLVLILLGDAMMRAHTEALNATGALERIVNTQDVFRGALGPAGLLLALVMLAAWWGGRGARPEAERLDRRAWAVAVATALALVGLLGVVAAGRLYAVEAAASGAVALAVAGLASGHLDRAGLRAVLDHTMAVSGALFALFVAATTFTLLLRGFGTDRVVADLVAALPGGAAGAVAGVLGLVAASAFVLDAFEIVFVVVPVVMPPLLARVGDAVWVSVLTLLVLQASFLLPPVGYAVMMGRACIRQPVGGAALVRALAPFLAAIALVLALTAAFPALVHLAQPDPTPLVAVPGAGLDQLERLAPPEWGPSDR
ncbi:MAG: TRAP transporter large permease subunit [Actinomycetota bacterium]